MKLYVLKNRCISAVTRRVTGVTGLPRSVRAPFLIVGIGSESRSLLSRKRLFSLYRHCTNRRLPAGSLVECGVGRGGAVAVMSLASGGRRPVWGFDSFEGMPALTKEDRDEGRKWVGVNCAGPRGLEEAQDTLRRFHVLGAWVTLVPGWFETTLPQKAPQISPVAVLRLDNDWYRSTRFCLETLYRTVAPGGIVIIDDYHAFAGCRTAVDEFREKQDIRSPLVTTEATSEVYWIKETFTDSRPQQGTGKPSPTPGRTEKSSAFAG